MNGTKLLQKMRAARAVLYVKAKPFAFLTGSRGIHFGAIVLLVLTPLDAYYTSPAIITLVLGVMASIFLVALLSLPREGARIHADALAMCNSPNGASQIRKRLIWPAAICLLLTPPIWFGALGVPQYSFWAGVASPTLMRILESIVLWFAVMLPAVYARRGRTYASPDAPAEIQVGRRDTLFFLLLAILAAWGWLLRDFWSPLGLDIHAMARIAFSLVIPAVLFISIHTHLAIIWHLGPRGAKTSTKIWIASFAHVVLCLLALALHGYDLLWYSQYQTAVRL